MEKPKPLTTEDTEITGPGTLVRYGDDSNGCNAVRLQFDAGRGTSMRLSQIPLLANQLHAIFFTHMHSDHVEGFSDIAQQRWLFPTRGPKLDVVCSGDSIGDQARAQTVMENCLQQHPDVGLAGVVGAIALFVLMAVGLYFAQVNQLKKDLSGSFAALHELQTMKSNYEQESKNFDKLVETIDGMSVEEYAAIKKFDDREFDVVVFDLTVPGPSDRKSVV